MQASHLFPSIILQRRDSILGRMHSPLMSEAITEHMPSGIVTMFHNPASFKGTPPMAKQPKALDDLFHDTLKDIYYAEKKILTTLSKMAKAARSAAFEKHRIVTYCLGNGVTLN